MESPAAARDLRMPSADAPQRDRRSERASTRDYASPTLHEDASLHAMTRRERVHAAKVERDAAFADRPAEPEQRVHPVMTGKDLGARRSRATARRMDAIQPRHSARFAGLREHHDEAED